MNPKIFYGELKRRNVYKVVSAYAVVVWLLIRVATLVFSVLGDSELGCSPGLCDDSPYKNLLARADLPTAS